MRFAILFLPCLLTAAGLPKFESQTIADDLRGGYQVVIADLNRDGKPDIIALASGMDELVWFENPSWTRHVLARGLKRMINCAVIGDFIVVAHGFENDASKSTGNISVLSRPADPRQVWSVREVDRLTTSHRLRVARVGGGEVVVNAPLTGAAARPPEYRDHVPLVYYRPGEWKREMISDANEGVQHGIFVDQGSILTASFSGLHRYKETGAGWKREEISKGDPAACPKCGSSDVVVLNNRTLAAIEPWHGNQVVLYQDGRRRVIDDSLVDGHSIAAADLNGDGRDEIIVTQRGAPGRVIVYEGEARVVLDEGITAASCLAADLDGDRRPEIVCIGSGSHNLKVYWNRESPRR